MSEDNTNRNNSNKTKSPFKLLFGGLVVLLAVIIGFSYSSFIPDEKPKPVQMSEVVSEVKNPEPVQPMQEETITIAEEALAKVVVYKSPTCGCCSKWVDHLRDAGFEVKTHDRDNMNRIKAELGISRNLQSCHTALVDGYTIEGHVPAEDIKRLLKNDPEVAGLSVPGMPIGSPGMEANIIEPYKVITFDKQGNTDTFTEYLVEDEKYLKIIN